MDMVFEVAPGDELAIDFGGALRLTLDADGIRLERRSLACDDALYRYWRGEVRALRILCDSSSIEISLTAEKRDEQPLFPAVSRANDFQRCDAGCILLLAAAAMHGRISVLISGVCCRDENQTRYH
ncbi:Sucrose-6-phosphate hydrolase [Raoultella terrigena]|uniref:Sucrose-6-phosphate hydrolase n=1 Tax=Raoultella terrigena TaxID=577 RepID=A0A4U9DAS2_RAOTE|nr:Sucrose-6-phosphate hydrolase [Raoultella terrigena]